MEQVPNVIRKTSPQLYRDCLRLVSHVGGKSAKGTALTTLVRGQFKKNANVKDEKAIEALQANAVRALSNYLLYESGSKDAKVKQRMSEQGTVSASGVTRAPIGGGFLSGQGADEEADEVLIQTPPLALEK